MVNRAVAVGLGAVVVAALGVLSYRAYEGNPSPAPVSASSAPAPPAPGPVAASNLASPPATSPPAAPRSGPSTAPPAAGRGDLYARNVRTGATCAPAGARGFTSHVQLVVCATTATDPHPRWRRP
jgi:hypothetical protein